MAQISVPSSCQTESLFNRATKLLKDVSDLLNSQTKSPIPRPGITSRLVNICADIKALENQSRHLHLRLLISRQEGEKENFPCVETQTHVVSEYSSTYQNIASKVQSHERGLKSLLDLDEYGFIHPERGKRKAVLSDEGISILCLCPSSANQHARRNAN